MENKHYKVRVEAYIVVEVEAEDESHAVRNAVLDVEDVCNQKDWLVDDVLGTDAQEMDE